ncbi:hypothetical protein BGZ83_011395 [Gryganskiella cystojenkinii]|nr:hypothetical protein BGZ83_011395 [Gryganskiella cystojenkinii]
MAQRPSTPPSPAPQVIDFRSDNNSSSPLSRRTHNRQSSVDGKDDYNNDEDSDSKAFLSHPQHTLFPMGDGMKGYKDGTGTNTSTTATPATPNTRTVVSIRILVILILISLFSWFYLEALAGGDIEWVKDHLAMLGLNLTLSVLCLTTAVTLITVTPMSTVFAGFLYLGMGVILFALKKWDDGESFETHGAYNMLVFMVIAVPLNGLIQSILLCQRKMSAKRFYRFMVMNVVGTTVLTTLLLIYYKSIWGNGAHGAHLIHGQFAGVELCEWEGLNLPVVDLLPNHIQNFWAGSSTCPVVTGIEAEWSHDGILTIQCLNNKDKSLQPTYDILPDTKGWPASEKVIHTYNQKINERIEKRIYTEPVLVNDAGIEAIIANCEESVSKVLIRLVRQDTVVERVEKVGRVQKEQEQDLASTEEEQALVDSLHGDQPVADQKVQDRKPNVLVLFMDAVSRRQFYRKLAKTSAFVESITSAGDEQDDPQGRPQLHEFFRYNAVGFNTDPNSRAVYTGNRERMDPALLPIWKDFHDAGYVTSRVEDNCEDWSAQYTGIATSEYFDHELQSPFCLPPYYALTGNAFGNFVGPYSIMRRCLHGDNVHNHAFEYMNQFRKAYPDKPWFQMGSFIEGHEGTGEVLLTIDNDFANFFKGMKEDGTLDNTIVIMMADHGLHMGINFMFSPSGRVEHVNPYLSVILPSKLAKKYPALSRGLHHNQQALITGYEIHLTLKALASGKLFPTKSDQDDSDDVSSEEANQARSATLFDDELRISRSCDEAQIPMEHCKCRVP